MTKGNAIITGAAKRIGRQIALDLARWGFNIAIHYNSSLDDAIILCDEIKNTGRKAVIIQHDLINLSSVAEIIKKANEQLGVINCLINNASIFENDNIANLDYKLWQNHIDINLTAPTLLSHAFAKQLPPNSKGNIINMLDYCVLTIPKTFFSYSISKAALYNATKSLALQLAPNIRVNAIGPGHTLRNERENEENFAKAIAASPLQTSSSLEDITKTIRFIMEMPSLTGQIITLDGGKHLISGDFYI